MIDRKTVLISGCLILALFVSGLAGWAFLPPDTPLKTIFVAPAMAAFIWGFFLALRRMDTRKGDAAQPMRAEGKMLYAAPLLMGLMQAYLLSHAFGLEWGSPRLITVTLGLYWMVMGNGMGKLRYGHPLGMRNPWTSNDPRVWDQAHRFGGWSMALAGTGAVVVALIIPLGWAMIWAMLAMPVAAILIILVRSRQLWRRLHPGEPALPMNSGTLSMVVGLGVMAAIAADFALEQGRSGGIIAVVSLLLILGLRYLGYRRQRR